ncbi:MAG: aerobic carbon-monoxide dehydrogenase small subunit [Thermotogota bacterium]|nr:aerobic carbon-monoxide dehydrogenase small subunit [Thermotogota bacterium]MDK2864957.1 aerobic carbon-monoxide dehydrogenase small subunit [Thermotogota bacterium]HCZ07005.1 (2Fe-2S)-binding protein [Thermotogota bacterium]
MKIRFTLNGERLEMDVREDQRVLDLLREELGLTGTKEGCGEGECGACTIIVDGRAVNSCLMLAPELDGRDVITIEGLSKDDEPDPIQKAFVDAGAVQCGFCTPGFVMSTKALLMKNPRPSREEIYKALEGNLCRCTGYVKILEAVENLITKEG